MNIHINAENNSIFNCVDGIFHQTAKSYEVNLIPPNFDLFNFKRSHTNES